MLPTECDVSDQVCCDQLWLIADHLLSSVYTALLDCFDADCPPLKSYITMGTGDDGVTDSLAVSFMGTLFSEGSTLAANKLTLFPLVRGTFDILLRESSWPMVNTSGGVVNAPDPNRQHALAKHAFAHGERMYRTLLSMHASRSLVPAGIKGCDASLGVLTPLPPLGGTVGWRTTVTVKLPWGGGQ